MGSRRRDDQSIRVSALYCPRASILSGAYGPALSRGCSTFQTFLPLTATFTPVAAAHAQDALAPPRTPVQPLACVPGILERPRATRPATISVEAIAPYRQGGEAEKTMQPRSSGFDLAMDSRPRTWAWIAGLLWVSSLVPAAGAKYAPYMDQVRDRRLCEERFCLRLGCVAELLLRLDSSGTVAAAAHHRCAHTCPPACSPRLTTYTAQCDSIHIAWQRGNAVGYVVVHGQGAIV